jgi:hypothetical protein
VGLPVTLTQSPLRAPSPLLCHILSWLSPTSIDLLSCTTVYSRPPPSKLSVDVTVVAAIASYGVGAWWLVRTSRWEPQEEGMISTTTSLPSVMELRFIKLVGESQTSEGDAC